MEFELPDGASLQAARELAARSFEAAGIDSAREDATALLCAASGLNRAAFIANGQDLLNRQARERFAHFVSRRLLREPVTRIIGQRGFWTLDLEVAAGVLDPRADSETVIRAALEHVSDRKSGALRILDMGSGSGALICALLREFPQATGTAIDVSPAACGLTLRNAQTNGVADRLTVHHCHWRDCPAEPCDLIVSNPPYVRSGEMAGLQPEVRLWDPPLALDGGADGLDAYRALAALLPRLLAQAGWVVLELGYDQAASVSGLMHDAGFRDLRQHRDLGGHIRALAGRM